MTVGFDEIVDRQIDKGRRRGLFEDLPGHGKPIADLDRPRQSGWWADAFIRNERAAVRDDELAKKVRTVRLALRRAPTEVAVTSLVEELNAEIAEHNRLSQDTRVQQMAELSAAAELEAFRRRQRA